MASARRGNHERLDLKAVKNDVIEAKEQEVSMETAEQLTAVLNRAWEKAARGAAPSGRRARTYKYWWSKEIAEARKQ